MSIDDYSRSAVKKSILHRENVLILLTFSIYVIINKSPNAVLRVSLERWLDLSNLHKDFTEMSAEEAQAEKDKHAVTAVIAGHRTDLKYGKDPAAVRGELLKIAAQPGWNNQLVRSYFHRTVNDEAWQAKIDAVSNDLD